MLNKNGIYKATCASPVQILADPNLQFSVGCTVPATAGTATSDGRKIAHAGLPITVNLSNLNEACKVVDTSSNVADTSSDFANAILLHDVDVTNGQNNGTALIFGFVDLSKVSSDMKSKIDTAFNVTGASRNIVFVKY